MPHPKRTLARMLTPIALLALAGTMVGTGAAFTSSEEPEPTGEGLTELDLSALANLARGMGGPAPAKKADFKPWKDVSQGFEKVVSTTDGGSFYGVWVNKKTNQMLAELPRGYEKINQFFAMTVAGGEIFAGLQAGDMYVKWKRYDDKLALIMPQLEIRSNGDQESKDSVDRIFTDRVVTKVDIVAMGPGGQPVIDLDRLLVGGAGTFFGRSARGVDSSLASIEKAKAFPENIEIAVKAPVAGGLFKTFHYSISKIQGTPGYRPREADERVGYFTTSYRDLGQMERDEVPVRYVNRWNLEKRDKSLKMSPPKEPIVWYVEHTAPVRYRRFIREGVEAWNKAFEQIGIVGAMEVRFQDKSTGAHMEKDPEDVRYNFIRWLSNDISTAIGPSRVNPMTGEILDADVVLTDGWTRVFQYWWKELMPELATEGYGPELMSWLDKHPNWDPRVRMADPSQRERMLVERARRGVMPYGGHPAAMADPTMMGDDEYDGLAGRTSQVSGLCFASKGKAMGMAIMRSQMDLAYALSQKAAEPEITPEQLEAIKKQLEKNPALLELMPEEYRSKIEAALAAADEPEDEGDAAAEGDEPKGDSKPAMASDQDLIDGLPAEFVGQVLGELVAHEVGHCIGLRHNFKGSSRYTVEEINSEDVKGKKPWSTTVMDYNPVNFMVGEGFGEVQGDWGIIDVGPYDMWAINYGYTLGDHKEVLKDVANPDHQFGTDEDTWGPDPLARRYDMGADPLTYAKQQIELAEVHRDQLLETFVKDGDSWSKARRGYLISLGQQTRAMSMMANWVGGAHVYRDKKGDPDGRKPIEVVDADTQRDALEFVIEHAFRDEAYGLTPEILNSMSVDKWWDASGFASIFDDPTFPFHDRILAVQASALTMLMNPRTLQRVLDNEAFVPSDEDALTLPEVLGEVYDAVWEEINGSPSRRYTAREPMISSLRRNLQREHVQRLIDLSFESDGFNAAQKPIAQLAAHQLRELKGRIDRVKDSDRLDAYTTAHLAESSIRIEKALDASYIYNMPELGGMIPFGALFGQEADQRD